MISRFTRIHLWWALGLFFLFFFLEVSLPPKGFPKGEIVTVPEGAGLNAVAAELKADRVIRNATWFRLLVTILGGEKNIQAGDYLLPHDESVYTLAWRIAQGQHGIETVKITIPEGYTDRKIAALFDERFALFSEADFLSRAEEGYMFPDTYYFGLNTTASSAAAEIRQNFAQKIFPFTGEIAGSGHSLRDILTMASILEAEAATPDDRRIISGILWKRLESGMPLQVDSTLTYVTGRPSSRLTQSDLAFDTPYNTYVYKGLPPAPIDNPGLDSIEAALEPSTTPYVYFLTGQDGRMHYAKTYAEHQTNIARYLPR